MLLSPQRRLIIDPAGRAVPAGPIGGLCRLVTGTQPDTTDGTGAGTSWQAVLGNGLFSKEG